MIATFPSSIQFLESSRCHIRGFRQRWSGNMVHSEGGRWFFAVEWSLLIGKETWSQHRLCVDRATSLCMVVSGHGHMRSRGQSSNYAEAMVGNGVVVWLTRAHCEMWMCVSFWRRHEVQWLNLVSEEFMTSSQSYTSRPTVNSDENEVKISAKMRHTYEARDVVNLFWRS